MNTLLNDDGSTPPQTRRRSPTPPTDLSPFPPRQLFGSSSYQPLPTAPASESSSHSSTWSWSMGYQRPYEFDYEAGSDASVYSAGGAQPGSLGAALLAVTRVRGVKHKVIIALGALGVLWLLTRAWGPRHDRPLHWHHSFPPPPPAPYVDDGIPPLPKPVENDPHRGVFHGVPPPTTTAQQPDYPTQLPVPKLETAELPIVNLEQFVQPRRKIRPAHPDPWADVTDPEFQGREWLSEDRFGSDEKGWRAMQDPPERDAPPAKYLLKAFEYAAAVAGRGPNGEKLPLAPGMAFDERTGRPKRLPHEMLKLGKDAGWKPPKGYRVSELGTGKMRERDMPLVQFEGVPEGEDDPESEREVEQRQRRDWVKRAFMHSWSSYQRFSYGHDEISPVSNLWSDNYNGWGATLVDNLDTLLIMNLSHEYNLAREHVAAIDFTYLVPTGSKTFSTDLPPLSSLDLSSSTVDGPKPPTRWVDARLSAATDPKSPTTIPLFETTIRYLGGLLSAYELSGDPLMLERATELGDWLLPSMATSHGLCVPRYTMGLNPDGQKIGRAVLAEVGSLTLEMTKLSMLTGNEIYYQAAQRAMDTLDTHFAPAQSPPKDPKAAAGPLYRGRLGTLLPAWVDPSHPALLQGEYGFGGLMDSYYEYLIKQAQLTSFSHEQYPRMYVEAIESAYEYLIRRIEVVPGREDLAIIGNMNWGTWKAELQHLTCFAGGMLGLGARLLGRPQDLETGINVTEACAWVYESSETGVGGEATTFYDPNEPARWVVVNGADGVSKERSPRGTPTGVRSANKRQIGRPETIESVFYMWRLTGDRKWQDRGWQMFTSWVEHSITEAGFATIADIGRVPVKKDDSQESFVTAETLKYYYLLFSPRGFMSLDSWTFTTEAHPLWIPKPSAPRPPSYLWTGPDSSSSSSSASFVSQMGEGTWVQKWARVQQAAKLAGGVSASWAAQDQAAAGMDRIGARPPGQAERRPFVRPSEEELEEARRRDREGAKEVEKKVAPGGALGGGGRGMGGRPA
ncbi:hypothetical protein JCM1841_001535 [Sporobolomyces salmonicolor]